MRTYLALALATIISIGVWHKYTKQENKSDEKTNYLIGIIQVVEHPALDQTRLGILEALKENGYINTKNTTVQYESAQGNPALATQIIQKFIGQKANLIIAIGTTVAQTAKQATQENKIPVIFASVTDPMNAKLVASLDMPGGNVTGVSNYISISKQFSFFKRLLPHLKNIGVVYNPGEANSVSIIDKMNEVSDVFDITLHTSAATKTSDVMAATQNLIGKTEAIFINNDNTALSAFDAVVKVANEHEIPVFVSDIDCIEKGALAALGPDQYELGKQAGQMAHRILSGKSPSNTPVEMPKKVHAKVNFHVSTKLGIAYQQNSTELFEGQ
ncbi:MAG: ABC transporter substrate-binding protein [Pseudomonadota bacterium]